MKLLIAIVLFPLILNGQIITTFVGGGSIFCENCSATTTKIIDPSGSVFDKNGAFIFCSGLGGNRIRRVDNLGIVNTIVGDGLSGFSGDGGNAIWAKLNTPEAVSLDKFGNLYIADANNYRVRKVDVHTGIITTVAGNGTIGYNGDGILATNAQIHPTDILLDTIGNIYIADYTSRRVRMVDINGFISTYAGTGEVGYSGDGGHATAAKLNPTGLAMDRDGNLYVADSYANVVRKINKSRTITTVAGNGNWVYVKDEIPATEAQIQPNRITIDAVGNLYISDNYNKRVFRVKMNGIIQSVAGNGVGSYTGDGGPATLASLDNNVSQLSVDSCGNLYISETSGRIRKVTFNPECLPLNVTDVNSEVREVKVYPNPMLDELNVRSEEAIQEVALYNAVGQLVLHGAGGGERSARLAVGQLPAGLYMVRVNGHYVNRIVKQW